MKISIIVVSYNAGNMLTETINSVLNQSFDDYEIIVQDGCSTDGSVMNIPKDERISINVEKDFGIYDAMNKASSKAKGDFLFFLNCGDFLYAKNTLEIVSKYFVDNKTIYYGDLFIKTRDGIVVNPKKINNFVLGTKTICHQSIFFPKEIFEKFNYDCKSFKYSSDYELYCKCYKKYGYDLRHIDALIVNYDCSGVSENIENKKIILKEKKKILKGVFTKKEYRHFVILKFLSLYALKERIGVSKVFQKLYQKISEIRSRVLKKKYKRKRDI